MNENYRECDPEEPAGFHWSLTLNGWEKVELKAKDVYDGSVKSDGDAPRYVFENGGWVLVKKKDSPTIPLDPSV